MEWQWKGLNMLNRKREKHKKIQTEGGMGKSQQGWVKNAKESRKRIRISLFIIHEHSAVLRKNPHNKVTISWLNSFPLRRFLISVYILILFMLDVSRCPFVHCRRLRQKKWRVCCSKRWRRKRKADPYHNHDNSFAMKVPRNFPSVRFSLLEIIKQEFHLVSQENLIKHFLSQGKFFVRLKYFSAISIGGGQSFEWRKIIRIIQLAISERSLGI